VTEEMTMAEAAKKTTAKKTAAKKTAAAPEPVAVAAKAPLHHTMAEGSNRGPVAEVQAALGLPTTGVFDHSTAKAVRAFQGEHGIKPSGIVDQATWDAL
jgi:peptidoglycan hydrolase-like protein with peptidoglycan-binding domain